MSSYPARDRCVLVNNAGMQYTAPVDEFPVEKWDQIIAVKLSAAFHTTRLCLPAMKEQKDLDALSTLRVFTG